MKNLALLTKLSRRKMMRVWAMALGLLSTIELFRRVQAQSEQISEKTNPQKSICSPDFSVDRLDREQIYRAFLELAASGVEDHPVLLYQGIENLTLQQVIRYYPALLQQIPDDLNLMTKTNPNSTFSAYPARGELPSIDEQSLDFLHKDIKEACICVSRTVRLQKTFRLNG